VNDEGGFWHYAYIVVASLAGAVTALSMRPWKNMTPGEVGFSLFVGSAFPLFFAPWLAFDVMHISATNLRAVCFLTYIVGAGSYSLLPRVIRQVGKMMDRLLGGGDTE